MSLKSSSGLIDEYVRYIKGQSKLDERYIEKEMKWQEQNNTDMALLLRKHFPKGGIK